MVNEALMEYGRQKCQPEIVLQREAHTCCGGWGCVPQEWLEQGEQRESAHLSRAAWRRRQRQKLVEKPEEVRLLSPYHQCHLSHGAVGNEKENDDLGCNLVKQASHLQESHSHHSKQSQAVNVVDRL